MSALFETRSLTKLYGPVIGVNDVTLTLEPGVHGLLGPNGAGKSTLLKLLTGQLKPTEGEIRVLGETPWNNPELFRKVGFCPEQDAFYSFLTGRQFVALLGRMSGLESARSLTRAAEILDRVGASEYMDRKIATYSRGQRQRTKLAQALVHDPDFLILDEPLSATDPVGRRTIMDLILGLGREGKSILISSHVLHEVEAMTKDFLLIYGGRVLASGNVHEIRAVMNEYPHRITIRCGYPRPLAQRLMKDGTLQGLELDEEKGELSIRTRDPKAFYDALPAAVLESGAQVREMVSQDDNLDAVFNYLVEGG